jgi:hypothetical protein
MLFSNRVNSWSKDRKEITEISIKTMGSSLSKHFLDGEMFRHASVLSNDP